MTTMTRTAGRNNENHRNQAATTTPNRNHQGNGKQDTPLRGGRAAAVNQTAASPKSTDENTTMASPTKEPKLWAEVVKDLGDAINKKQRTNEHKPMDDVEAEEETEVEVTKVTTGTTATVTNEGQEKDKEQEAPIQAPPLPARMRTFPKALSAATKYATYFDVKMPIPGSGGLGAIFAALGRFAEAVYKADKSMMIFPFNEKDRRESHTIIKDQESWNTVMKSRSFTTLRTYFPNAGTFANNDGYRVVQVLIGTSIEPKRLIMDMHDFLRPDNGRYWFMFTPHLQTEEPVPIGWLFLSMKNIDAERLRDEIQKIVGFPIGLQWRIITPSSAKRLHKDVRALHFLVDKNHQVNDTEILSAMYAGCRKEGWPLGIKMRFVHDAKSIMGKEDPANLETMRSRQNDHTNRVKFIHTTEIIDMESKVSGLKNQSIREILMSFRASNPKAPLVLNVGPGEKGVGFNVYVLPQYETEGQTMVNALYPYLKHQIGPERVSRLKKVFSDGVVRRCHDMVWDEVTGSVRSKMSIALANLVNNEDDAAYFEGMEVVHAHAQQQQQQQQVAQLRTNVEEGSIGSGDTHTVHMDVLGANPMLINAAMFAQQTHGTGNQVMDTQSPNPMPNNAAMVTQQVHGTNTQVTNTQGPYTQTMNAPVYGTPQGMLMNPYMQRANFPRQGLGRGGGADNYAMYAAGHYPNQGLAESGWGSMVIDNQGPQGMNPPGPPERGWGAGP
jgi:hypothetical protein